MTFWEKLSTNKKNLNFQNLICSFFFCGYFKFMPGTVASFVVFLLSSLQFTIKIPFPFNVPLIFFLFSIIFGVCATKKVLSKSSEKDPSWIVIDEVAGQSLSFLIVPQSIIFYFIAFLFFRFFDILKPFPIKNFEKLEGFWGVFADDIMAGIFAAVAVRFIILFL